MSVDARAGIPEASARSRLRRWGLVVVLTMVAIPVVVMIVHARSTPKLDRLPIALLPPVRADARPLDQAKRAYESGDYARAESELLVAARGGDTEAEELLGVMEAFGPTIYPGVTEDLTDSSRWLDQAARSGRPVARYIYCALLRHSRGTLPGFYCFDPTAKALLVK
jgi:TPR repeat protein